jgi:xanthine dehydrogenase large subunit
MSHDDRAMPRDGDVFDDRPLTVVAKPHPHDSARLHVTGAATYIDDMREPAGTLHVACGLSPKARGRILAIDLAAVRAAPDVVTVLTSADIPGDNDIAPSFADEPLLADNEVLFHGQPLFAVVARSRDAARRAARLAHVTIEDVEPIVSIEDALAAGTRVQPDYDFGRGDATTTLDASPRRLAASLHIGGQEHFYLEGQVALAIPGESGGITVHSSTQDPAEVQHIVARVLGLPAAAVVVETRRMGGAFGGKERQACQWAALAALAAHITGCPAKMRLDRDDDFALTGKRHDFRADWQAGFDDDGRLTAYDVVLNARCGCSVDLSPGVVDRAMFHAANAYYVPAVHISSRRLRTDTVSNTAFRGFGGPQGMLVIERVMDAIARATGRDPLDVRKTNLHTPGRDITPYGMRVEDTDVLPRLIADLEHASEYRARRAEITAYNAHSRWLRRGIALTPVQFGISFTLPHLNQAGALVHVYQDGSVLLNHGGAEMGQGLFVKVAQVVAEEFGIPLEFVRPSATSTAIVPNASPTAASAGSDLNGMAARIAAAEIKVRLAAFAASLWEVGQHEIAFANGRVSAGNKSMTFAELAHAARRGRIHLSAAGYYRTPDLDWNREARTGRPFYYFAYGAACSEVVIDTATGEMRLSRVDILHDVGRSLNPAIDIGQIEGGFVQGLGWLTTEELVYDSEGRLATHAPSTYKIPVAADVPAMFNVRLANTANPKPTIYRSKGVGEPPLMLAISVFSAITDALASLAPGHHVPLDAPATPERILMAAEALRSATGRTR